MDSDQATTSTAAMEIERVPSEPKSGSGVPPIKPKFEPLKAQEMSDGRVQFRKVSVPAHRFTPLKKAWMEIYTPIFEQMKIDVRMNLKARKVELKTRTDTPDVSNLQKCADFVHAFMLGFDVIDAVALLRLDDLYVDSFEIKDVKTLRGEHLSRAIGRLSGKGGKTKFAIENATRTRIVIADTKIHILGSFLNIKVARDSLCSLILGSPAGKIISGLHNLNKENVASVVTAADQGGATHVDIACDPELVKLAVSLTSLPICVSSVDPEAFPVAVEAGAQMVEIGNYDSFYEIGRLFSPEQILKLTKATRRILPSVTLSVTVPHTLSLPDQVKLAELLEQEGADIIQTEGGKSSNPSKPGVLGLIEKATPTLAAAYSISRAVQIPVMCSSGLSAVTAPMALTAGAAGVGVGSAVNKLNDVVAMIAQVKSIADSLKLSTSYFPQEKEMGALKH